MSDDRIGSTARTNEPVLSRRELLKRTVVAGGAFGLAAAAPARGAIAPLTPVLRYPDDLGQLIEPGGAGVERSSQDGGVSLQLARILNRPRFEDLPAVTVKHAKVMIASTLASAAPGSQIGSARIIRELSLEQGGAPEATVWYDGTSLPLAEAARVNAILSDAAASDDSDLRNVAHCGTTLTSVGLAVGELMGASGRELLLAMVTGYEAAGRIGEARVGGREGVHASQIVAFGGTVAAGKLLGLSDGQMAHALGITAVTQGGISIGTNSWAREYMAANAASCGVNAALAASRGFTVNGDLLDAPRGFPGVYGGGSTDSLTQELDEWDLATYLAVKLWPGAHPFSSTVEAAVNVARQADVSPDDVSQILISGPNRRSIGGSRRPQDLIEAIHSLPYFVASAVADQDFSWVHASPEKIDSPVTARLMQLVELDPSPPAADYDWGWGGTVVLVTGSGDRYTSTVDAPRGSAPRGIEWSDIDAKYRALMPDSGLSRDRAEEALSLIHDFEEVGQVNELTRLLG